MPISSRPAQQKLVGGHVILLTGSTGSLGSYILDSLQQDSSIRRIYCLNRGPDSLARQQKSLSSKGLKPLTEKVQCLDANLSKTYFGFSTQEYRELLSQVTLVIHNAWKVDFNISIDSFNSHVSIVRQFIDFSAHSSFGAQLFFVSSISAVSGQSSSVAEQIFGDWHTPEETGYGQSKFISERLLDTAAGEARVPAVVCRVGQVAGPMSPGGMWPKQEWLPSLIASSKYLGKLPSSLGRMETVDWIPVDVLGKTVVELATRPPDIRNAGATVYHAVNPYRTSWAKLVPTVARYSRLGTVPLEEWIDALRESTSKTEDLTQNPAVKILDFFEGLVKKSGNPILLDTSHTLGASRALANLEPIQEAWMENWMRQWNF
ncbi:NAD(P)-binding protein [Hypoxylon sp. EC38]|nr:NAD(P)-binding protein [Hypoxylon sp. EC38]